MICFLIRKFFWTLLLVVPTRSLVISQVFIPDWILAFGVRLERG